MPQRHIDLDAEEEKFKSEIYTMLLAFGTKRNQAIQIISANEELIRNWIDPRGKGSIVTAANAARIMLKKDGMASFEETS